ncbi:hypothetical protein NMY22_g16855 [Coprinellus aureogranulatus]|nr:hypothetical protein NMY22_g16855 [Coprinellus aureogranulatus]
MASGSAHTMGDLDESEWCQTWNFIVYDGERYYSPNCTRSVTFPSPLRPFDPQNPFQQGRTWHDLRGPQLWSRPYGWTSYIPRRIITDIYPLDCLAVVPPANLDISGQIITLPSETMTQWIRVAKGMARSADVLITTYSIPAVAPYSPLSWLRKRHRHISYREMQRNVSNARAWFMVWVGLLTFAIRFTEHYRRTQANQIAVDPHSALPPDWRVKLQAEGFSRDWTYGLDVLAHSAVDRAGIVFHDLFQDPVSQCNTDPKLTWWYKIGVPIWVRWDSRTVERLGILEKTRSLHRSFYPPPSVWDHDTERLPTQAGTQSFTPGAIKPNPNHGITELTHQASPRILATPALPTVDDGTPYNSDSHDRPQLGSEPSTSLGGGSRPRPQETACGTALDVGCAEEKTDERYQYLLNQLRTVREINGNLEKNETASARQDRLNRERLPPSTSAPVYVWEVDWDNPRQMKRATILKCERSCTLAEYTENQKVYFSSLNCWHCSKALDPTGFVQEDWFDDEGVVSTSAISAQGKDTVQTLESGGKALTSEPNDIDEMELTISGAEGAENHLEPIGKLILGPDLPSSAQVLLGPTSTEGDEVQRLTVRLLADLRRIYGFVPLLPGAGELQPLALSPAEMMNFSRALGYSHDPTAICKTLSTSLGADIYEFYCAFRSPGDLPHRVKGMHDLDRACWSSIPPTTVANMLRSVPMRDVTGKPHGQEKTIYMLNTDGRFALATEDPLVALTMCRLAIDQATVESLSMELLSMGIPFRTLHMILEDPSPDIPKGLSYSLPERDADYHFTPQDYLAYERRIEGFLQNPRMRGALLCGGILWRLAYSVLGAADVLRGPTLDGGIVLRNEENDICYVDDELTFSERQILQGTYKCWTGEGIQFSIKSWWPPKEVFDHPRSGDVGVAWTDFKERWYQRRRNLIMEGKAQPLTVNRWRDVLRGRPEMRQWQARARIYTENFIRDVEAGRSTYESSIPDVLRVAGPPIRLSFTGSLVSSLDGEARCRSVGLGSAWFQGFTSQNHNDAKQERDRGVFRNDIKNWSVVQIRAWAKPSGLPPRNVERCERAVRSAPECGCGPQIDPGPVKTWSILFNSGAMYSSQYIPSVSHIAALFASISRSVFVSSSFPSIFIVKSEAHVKRL